MFLCISAKAKGSKLLNNNNDNNKLSYEEERVYYTGPRQCLPSTLVLSQLTCRQAAYD
jgi:hypothetical protein